ncbi:MAG: PilW family protein [Pseudomonadota bacterium]
MKKKTSFRQQGFNLVELLVAMAIGLLVLLAVSSVFVSTRSTGRGQDAVSRLQENLRFSFDAVGGAVRRAGYRYDPFAGYAPPGGFAADTLDGISFTAGQYIGGTASKLVVRYWGASDGLSRDCTGAAVPAGSAGIGNTPHWESWYVSGGNLVCKVKTNPNAATIIEGVEQIRFEYGENTGGAGDSTRGVDVYHTNPASVSDWTDIAAVRMEILLASADNAVTSAQKYTFNGIETTPTDLRLRRVYTATFNVRN